MLGWLKSRAPLQGSVWFAKLDAFRPEALPLFADPRIARGEPEWKEGGHWRMTVLHPLWGPLTIISVADPPPLPATLAGFHALSKAERAAVMSAQSALYLEMPPNGENVLRERKALLQALAAIGGAEAVAAVDHMAQRLWTMDDLADELAHAANLDIESVFSLHAVLNAEGSAPEWLHTHGLAELGGFDFHIVQPRSGAEFNARTEATRALAGMILEGRVRPDGGAFPLFGKTDACFLPIGDFLAKAEGHAPAVLTNCVEEDEVHRAIAAVLCNPPGTSMLGRLFGRAARPSAHDAVWAEGAEGAAVTAFTEGMTALMGERAVATYGVLKRLVGEFEAFGFPIGVKLAYETDRGGREHLWFRPHTFADETMDATLENPPFNIRGMKLGDRGVHSIGRMTDWLIGTPAGHITPRSQVVARIIREHPDEIRQAMKSGWPN